MAAGGRGFLHETFTGRALILSLADNRVTILKGGLP
jgi:hypothetical protein